jgi:Peptidase family M28
MLKRSIGLISLALLTGAGHLAAQRTSPDITPADLRLRLFALADDSMGGRATGSLGNFKAAEWVASEFKRLGLEPAGENGTYFQTIPFFRLKPDPRVTLAVNGTPLALGVDVLPIIAPTAPRLMDGAQAIYGGPVGDSTQWISTAEAKGKIVVFAKPAVQGRGFGAILGQLRQSRRFATAALIAIDGLDETAPELVAALLDGRVVTDTTRTMPAPLLALVSARGAERLIGRPLAGAKSGTPGNTIQGETRLGLFPLDYPARNVVAVRRGADPALRNTYVSLTGHNDHVGFDHSPVDHDSLRAFDRVIRPMGADSPNREPTAAEWKEVHRILDSLRAIRPPRPDSIRNGADDDGTGTVALLEIAEKFASQPAFRRSILFVSHTAEEEGLLGSAWFTDHATVPVDSIVSELDMDMIGRGDRIDLPEGGPGYLELVGSRRLSNEYGEIIDRVNARQPEPFQFNLTYDAPGHPLQYYCRADHYSYGRYGIPAVAFSRGEHLDYHQVTDEPQYIDYEALSRVAHLAADVAAEVASLDHRPTLDRPKGDPHARCVQ